MPSKISTSRTSEIRLLRPARSGVDLGVPNSRSLRYVCGETAISLILYVRCVDLSSATFNVPKCDYIWFFALVFGRARYARCASEVSRG